MLKKTLAWIAILAGMVILVMVVVVNQPVISIEAYLYDSCGGCFTDTGPCKPCKAVEDYSIRLREANKANNLQGKVKLDVYNVMTPFYKQQYMSRLDQYQIEDSLPVVFVDGQVYTGNDAIQLTFMAGLAKQTSFPGNLIALFQPDGAEIKKDRPLSSRDENVIVYFYLENCEECKKMNDLLAEQQALFPEDKIDRRNYLEEQYLYDQFLELYQINQNQPTVPLVFAFDQYFKSADELEQWMENEDEISLEKTRVPAGYEKKG